MQNETTSIYDGGLDPVEFIKIARQNTHSNGRKKKRRRRPGNRRLIAQESVYGKKKEILEINEVPRAEFLLPG